jgi:hypothetical protein
MILPAQIMIERFKKTTLSKKHPQHLLDLMRKNEDEISLARSQIREKSLKDPSKVLLQFVVAKNNLTLAKESVKLN